MKIVSTDCFCGNCLDKYDCPDYAMIVTIQNLAKKYLGYGTKKTIVLIRTEKCCKRKEP